MQEDDFDVVIVGGGLSGVSAAFNLSKFNSDLSICVLEAKDRLGGRTFTTTSDFPGYENVKIDLGGQWIGPTQYKIHELVKELGITTVPQYSQGKKILDLGNKTCEYSGTIPKISIASLIEVQTKGIWSIDRKVNSLNLEDLESHKFAHKWDSMSLQVWMDTELWTQDVKGLLSIACVMVFGVEPSQISFLYFLYYCKCAGGVEALLDTEGGAQDTKLQGGSQQISERLAEEFLKKNVKNKIFLSDPVLRIEHGDHVAILTDSGKKISGKKVIVSLPPPLIENIDFSPELNLERRLLQKRTYMGCYTKAIVSYKTPFWRNKGYAGECINLKPTIEHPVRSTFDFCIDHEKGNSDEGKESFYALLCFIAGDMAIQLALIKDKEQRREKILKSLTLFYGDDANIDIMGYQDQQWSEEPYSQGCPVINFPPGCFLPYHKNIKNPTGNVHFAGTETSNRWTGYMEGACLSGERVAEEIIKCLP